MKLKKENSVTGNRKIKNKRMRFKNVLIILFFLAGKIILACDCAAFPPLTLSLFNKENPRQIVFKGKVLKVGDCDELATCTFEVQELYFGKSTKILEAVFECS